MRISKLLPMRSAAPWLDEAYKEIGVAEEPGKPDNPRILMYLRTVLKTSLPKFLRDETAWCSAFVNWCMVSNSVPGTGAPNARSWLRWGESCPPRVGAVCVFKRGVLPWQGHVGFYIGESGDNILVLGGSGAEPKALATFFKS